MPKTDTPAKIAAELRGLAADMYRSGRVSAIVRDAVDSELALIADRLDAIKPGPVKGWWRAWWWNPKAQQWAASPAVAESKLGAIIESPWKGWSNVVVRPFDPSDTGPKRPPKGVKR